jgi:hypothetical protein
MYEISMDLLTRDQEVMTYVGCKRTHVLTTIECKLIDHDST